MYHISARLKFIILIDYGLMKVSGWKQPVHVYWQPAFGFTLISWLVTLAADLHVSINLHASKEIQFIPHLIVYIISVSVSYSYASFPIFDMLFMSLGIPIKVLLGETPGCELNNQLPSKAGLRTVLEVLKIQMNFWPTLASTLKKLESEWGSYLVANHSEYPFVCIFFPTCSLSFTLC